MAKYRDQYELDVQTKNAQAALDKVKVGFAAVTAVAATAAAAIGKLTVDGLSMVDAQAKLARSLDATADGVRAVQIAASDAGVDGMEESLNRLNRRLGAASQGNKEYEKAVEQLNLDLGALSEMDADERVAAIADAVKASGQTNQETARTLQTLGFEQANANALFSQGGDAIRAARDEVDEYGLSLSEVDSIQVERANDAMSRVGRSLEVVQQRLAVGLAPLLETVANLFNNITKENHGFRDAIDGAIDIAVNGMAFVVDAVEGVRRVFQLAGKTVALFGLGVADVMLTVANAIVNKPVQAINELIAKMNTLLEFAGFDGIEPVGLSELGQTIDSELKTVRLAQEIAIKDMQALLMKPLPGNEFVEEYERIKKASREAAEQQIEDRKTLEDGQTESQGASVATIAEAQKSLEKDLAASRERIRKAQEQAMLSGFDGLQQELKKIELEEQNLLSLAKERVREQFGENADSEEAIEKLRELERAHKQSLQARQQAARTIQRNEENELERKAELESAEERRQRTFAVGWKNAFDEYQDNATNAAQTAQRLFTQATDGMEDAIVGFAKTGKFEFKDMIADMVETLLRSQIQQMMAGLVGGGGSGGSYIAAGAEALFGGFFATGGQIPAGRFGVVGERGPELVSGPANVEPNIGGGNVTYNINAVDAASFKQLVARDPSFIHAVSEQGRKKVPQTRR